MNCRNIALLIAVVSIALVQTKGQDKAKSECPMMSTHRHEVNRRGDQVMGFSHGKTTHHFRMFTDGGEIEVQANDSKDLASRDQIRTHLAHIASMFTAGDFNAPMLIHSHVPPGVPTMRRLKGEITYQFSELDQGGAVRITTHSAEALKAVHEFLTFQITDHQTGDTLKVSNGK